jgi:hypothetical protein
MAGWRIGILVAVVVACGVASLLVPTRPGSGRLRLWHVLVLGGAIRVLVAILAQPITPPDVADYFGLIGREVIDGRDPAVSLPGPTWSFLPLMPYVWAAMQSFGMDWTTVMKVVPIASDLAVIWLIGLITTGARSSTARLLYALSPIAVLVVSVHGQVEPTSLAFAVGGIALLQRDRDLAAGVLFGLAIATKTWPALIVLPVLLPMGRRALRPAISAASVMAALALSSMLLLGTTAFDLAGELSSYTSFAGYWGWSGTIASFGRPDLAVGYDSDISSIGSALVALAVVATLVLYRRSDVLRRAWTTSVATLVVSAGFGPQYLLWPVPFLIANDERRAFFTVSATALALVSYLPLFPGEVGRQPFVTGLSWVVIAAIVTMLASALPAGVRRRWGQVFAPVAQGR